eukprot:TRINITY_DN2215_c1_g1_i1.p1 TRINITY_DN2215_c1_g1~~TRINITY_DN2215_c1_g1_i1.p1  ORF type:complete len:181 (-),score=25.50 TRINITY_DN2215_c1_g1_i1:39-581(-)
MIRSILQYRKKAIFILPFVSVVSEKVSYLESVVKSDSINITVGGYYGNHVPKRDGTGDEETQPDIAVCTIEKANSLVNKMLSENSIDTIGVVVVDEIHMIADQDRGYLLELLVTKILYSGSNNIQIVGLSATLPNIEVFEKWFKASIYQTNFRPVPLNEYIKVDNIIYDKDWNVSCDNII